MFAFQASCAVSFPSPMLPVSFSSSHHKKPPRSHKISGECRHCGFARWRFTRSVYEPSTLSADRYGFRFDNSRPRSSWRGRLWTQIAAAIPGGRGRGRGETWDQFPSSDNQSSLSRGVARLIGKQRRQQAGLEPLPVPRASTTRPPLENKVPFQCQGCEHALQLVRQLLGEGRHFLSMEIERVMVLGAEFKHCPDTCVYKG